MGCWVSHAKVPNNLTWQTEVWVLSCLLVVDGVVFGSQHCFREGGGCAAMRSGDDDLSPQSKTRVHPQLLFFLGYGVGYLGEFGVPGAACSAAIVVGAAQLGGGGGDGGNSVELGLAGGPRGRRVGRPQRAGWAVHFACKKEIREGMR